ncbi:hypothetical protein [Roseospira visakhapatnamensis]|uniref:Uncharacterized protein n=1 Tax=Roseospira visakhapatnamensis TaxID=390880 RepID=A0A7W6R9Q7_9PROT|nr:hypothetical protein [Roseospira visakhapatnamensis]MBB4264488.1 hypothetical protein [Roseospira visakhapatnamensis]
MRHSDRTGAGRRSEPSGSGRRRRAATVRGAPLVPAPALAVLAVVALLAVLGTPGGAGAATDGQAAHAVGVTDLPAPAASCGPRAEGEAPPPVIATRALQTRLMVAALTCDQREAYGVFVTRFRTQLSVNADSLTTRFRGRGGQGQVDRLVTRLANGAAADSIRDRDGFCARATVTLERLATTAPGDLGAVALEAWRGAGCPAW